MKWFLRFGIFAWLFFWCSGCNTSDTSVPVWQQVKIGDLAPSRDSKASGGQALKTINFSILVFELPAENIKALDEVWRLLYTNPVHFKDADAFKANWFAMGFGQGQLLNRVVGLLQAADGRKAQTASLLLLDGQVNDLPVTKLFGQESVVYNSAADATEQALIGPGRIALRVKAQKLLSLRRLCNLTAQPVFISPVPTMFTRFGTAEKRGELTFSAAAFEVKMSPGDFFVLGPQRYNYLQTTLDALLFSKPEGSLFVSRSEGDPVLSRLERKPAIRLFVLICIDVNY